MMSSADRAGRAEIPRWLEWVRTLQSVAQSGLAYAHDPYDVERYREVRRVAAEIGAEHSAGEPGSIEGFFTSERGYPTPKIDVRSAVIVDNRILLVQERDDGGWALPGGWADVGETGAQAAVRETREEAGLAVRAVKLIALYDRERHGHPPHPEYSYKAFFACELCGRPEPCAGSDMQGAGFFDRADLPALSVARVTPAQIALAFSHHAHPELPTEFD